MVKTSTEIMRKKFLNGVENALMNDEISVEQYELSVHKLKLMTEGNIAIINLDNDNHIVLFLDNYV